MVKKNTSEFNNVNDTKTQLFISSSPLTPPFYPATAVPSLQVHLGPYSRIPRSVDQNKAVLGVHCIHHLALQEGAVEVRQGQARVPGTGHFSLARGGWLDRAEGVLVLLLVERLGGGGRVAGWVAVLVL